uniref:Glucose-methanol-choline oxidoreductase N-terminal domain-containing protein n=2 Tax=Corethron hystrix TaxID=216773 RepID=A0A7S1BHR9_9STRA
MDEVKYQNPLSKKFLEIGAAAGLGSNDDFNNWDREQDGVGRFQVSEKKGARVSGATAFLSKAMKRKNLKVRTGTMVRRINFDSTKTSTGVTYDLLGDDSCKQFSSMLKEGGEVLLTGGAIGSPQLLMCSGVGPASHLKEHGVEVVEDLPGVGENLQDHPSGLVSFGTPKRGISVTSKLRIPGTKLTNPLHILKWLFFGTGLLTSTGCDHGAFVKTPAATDGQADLQIRFIAGRALTPDAMTTYSVFRNTKHVKDGYTFQTIAARARSRGNVRLASSNTNVKPSIFAGYLTDPNDLITIREGIKLGRRLGNMAEWGDYKGEEVYPGPEVQTDEQIDEYIRNTVHSANALVGTCKMGADDMSVVGFDLKVHGINGVRVVDASVIPKIMGGQTGTPVVMIAERAAAFLKNSSLAPKSVVRTTPAPELATITPRASAAAAAAATPTVTATATATAAATETPELAAAA